LDNNDALTELVDYKCGDCGGESWTIYIGHTTDGRTFLMTVCANKECVKNKRDALKLEEEQFVIWDEFEISGQGHDYYDHHETDMMN